MSKANYQNYVFISLSKMLTLAGLFLLVLSSASASSAVLVASYPDGYRLAEEVKLTAENYYDYEIECGRDVRYISSLDKLTKDDDILYIVAHGNTDGYIESVKYTENGKMFTKHVSWRKLLSVVNEFGITNLILDTCKSTEAQNIAETMTFANGLYIYSAATYSPDSTSSTIIGHATFYSFFWKNVRELQPKYCYYPGSNNTTAKDIRSKDFTT